jgi:3-hydroxyacyl-CoA dehydrogenase
VRAGPTLAVVGAGAMGSQIAYQAAPHGYDVRRRYRHHLHKLVDPRLIPDRGRGERDRDHAASTRHRAPPAALASTTTSALTATMATRIPTQYAATLP